MRSTLTLLVPTLALMLGCQVGEIEMSPRDPGFMPMSGDAAMPDGSSTDAGPMGLRAQDIFDGQVAAMLDSRCGACHLDDRTGPAFLGTLPTMYAALIDYPGVLNFEDTGLSRLITKGEHAGPAWLGTERAVVRAWIELESAERAGGGMGMDGGAPEPDDYATEPQEPIEGFNAVDLADMGLPGTTLTFIASRIEAGIFLSELRVFAGPAGARLVHPVLVTWVGATPTPDPVDRFSGLDVRVDPSSSELVGSGSVSLVGFPEGGSLSFLFDSVTPLEGAAPPGDDGGVGDMDGGVAPPPTSGCRDVAAFTMNAQPQLNGFCVGCHAGGNPTAMAAVDMASMADLDPAEQRLACNEILGRVNLADPANSAIVRESDPASGISHPFKFPSSAQHDAFKSAILLWIASE